jgi:molecular chaperone DnaK (HSP70)
MTRSVLGIDLGTTNSVVATLDSSGRIVVLRNAAGQETTPSAMYLESSGQAVVGEEARQLVAIDPDNGVVLIKRQMGTYFPLRVRDQDHTPESISALILRQLVAAAEPTGRPQVVITVPAYFGTAEREATIQAGRIAGLDVLELLDEPVAAAMHYGLTTSSERTVLVYDLGGGTFDTTVLRICDGKVQVIATDGHSSLGGADVDKRLLDLVLNQLEGLLTAQAFDEFVDDDVRTGTLLVDIETVKRDLSARTTRELVVRTASDRITLTLRRDQVEEICGDLFLATTEIIGRVLDKARVKGITRIDEVIMVGGSSRIPLIAPRLAELIGVTPRLVDPDLAVAKGAALRAHQLAGTPELRALAGSTSSSSSGGIRFASQAGQVIPVAPRAIGILVDDSFDPSGTRTFVEHLVQPNTELPVEEHTGSFGTIIGDQSSVRIQVYEQAGPAPSPEVDHNRRVLDGELTGLGSLPAGSVIEITIAIAVDGRLMVIAREPKSGRELTLEAYMEGVVDTVEAERLTQAVGLIAVRG